MSRTLASIRISLLKDFTGVIKPVINEAGLHWLLLQNINKLKWILRRLIGIRYVELLEFANLASASANYWRAQVQVNTSSETGWNLFDRREKKTERLRVFMFWHSVSEGVSSRCGSPTGSTQCSPQRTSEKLQLQPVQTGRPDVHCWVFNLNVDNYQQKEKEEKLANIC